jgi:hypothetical protein
MSDEMEMAEHLDRMLGAPTLATITGDPEFVAMTALAGEVSSALSGTWTSTDERLRIWQNAMTGLSPAPIPRESLVARAGRPVLAHKKSFLAGGAALGLSAMVGWAVIHRHRHAA